MNRMIIIFYLILFINISSQKYDQFNDYFHDSTMRVDYYHVGNSDTEIFTIDRIYKQGIWAGSRTKLIDLFNNGAYYYKIYDATSNKLIYSKGFDSYFKEYQTSEDAQKGINRSYHESALIPYPKNNIRLSIEKRDDKNKLKQIFSFNIDPKDIMIIDEKINDDDVEVAYVINNGDPHKKLDIVIIAEGYTKTQKDKYLTDLKNFANIFTKYDPYKKLKDHFNIAGVFKPSQESGVDEPRAGIFKNTTLNATFNSLGSERYLLTEDNKTLRDLAANVPYDAIYIMVNHSRYGGGGIYNWSCTFTTDNQFNEYLFVHEFGHSFAGLADEYYTSSTAYDNFYKSTLEPVEPNVTALIDKEDIKWKELLTPGIQLPTKWSKDQFDSTDYKWQERRRQMNNKIANLKRNNADKELIKKAELEYVQQDKARSDEVDKFLKHDENYGKVGAFEGAGYLPKGLYRPMIDCIMFSKGDKPFCKVCESAIEKVIMHYSE